MSDPKNEDEGYFFTAYITLKNGKVLYARQVGLKAFRIPIREKKPKSEKKPKKQ